MFLDSRVMDAGESPHPRRTVEEFSKQLRKLVDHFTDEWDLSYSEAVGTLEIMKHILIAEAMEMVEIEAEEEEDPSGDG